MAVRTGPQPMPGMMPQMPGIMGAPMGPPPGMPPMGGMPGMPPMPMGGMPPPMPMPMGGPMGGPPPGPQGGRPASLGTLPAPSTAEQRAGFGAAVGSVMGRPVPGSMPADVFAGGIPGGMMDGSIPRPVAMMRRGGVVYMDEGGDPAAQAAAQAQAAAPYGGYTGPVRFMEKAGPDRKNPLTGRMEQSRFILAMDDQGNIIDSYKTGFHRKTSSYFVDEANRYKALVQANISGTPVTVPQSYGNEFTTINPGSSMSDPFKTVRANEDGSVTIETINNMGIRQAPTITTGAELISPGTAVGSIDSVNLLNLISSGVIPVQSSDGYTGTAPTGAVSTQPSDYSSYGPINIPSGDSSAMMDQGLGSVVPVTMPDGTIVNQPIGSVLGTSAGPIAGSVYQPNVYNVPTFVGGMSDVFGTRPVTYVGSPQATIGSQIGEIDLPARPQSINVFDWLASPVAGYGGLR